jgi:hypothetical protein
VHGCASVAQKPSAQAAANGGVSCIKGMQRMHQRIGSCLSLVALLCACNSEAVQSVNFSEIMPKQFQYCGQEIKLESAAYQSLFSWFKNNIDGWHNSPASYVPGHVFKSESMTVNIISNQVIVNYQTNNSWSQLVKSAQTSGTFEPCK